MKKNTLKFLTVLIAGFGLNTQAQHCAVTGTVGDGSVRNVADVATTGGSTNIDYTGANGTDNYLSSAETVTITEGGVFNLAVTPGGSQGPGVRIIAYIDWNGDDDFEDADEVFLVSPEATWTDPVVTFDMDITVPAGAVVGLTKMRILGGDSWAYNDDTTGNDPNGPGYPLSPCGQFNNTSWKDFNVEITAAAPSEPCAVTGTVGDGSVRNVADVATTGGSTNIDYTGANGTDNYLSSAETVTITEGGVFNLAVTPGGSQGPGVRIIAYIDWNGDDDFEDADEVFLVSPEATWTDPVVTFDMDITVPAGAVVGLTKMRILGGDSWAYNDDTTGNDPNGPGYPLSPCGQYNNTSWKDFNVEIEAELGVDDLSQDLQFVAYPNPLKGNSLNLRMNVQNQTVTVELYNIVGKKIQSVTYESFNKRDVFQLPSLSKGVYLMKISVGNKIYTHKLLK